MTEQELYGLLKSAKTKSELDALRSETVAVMEAAAAERGERGFQDVQKAFIKAKNRLRRIPLSERL